MKSLFGVLSLLALLGLVIKDSAFHFDYDRVIAKRQNNSAQRHWSTYYLQQYTYLDGSFKYHQDIDNIRELIEPNHVVLSDRATSYYLAAELPVYVKNVHDHHNRSQWQQFLKKSYLCYLDDLETYGKATDFILQQERKAIRQGMPELKYWVINRDTENLNLRYDCLATRASRIMGQLEGLGSLLYQGEFLWLYQVDLTNAQLVERQ